ncbi:MAG TPA: hypothetical protein DHU56_01635 [Marinobacter sp.]|jgi:hypothetical protein|nr:hypothetical protein [Marinobacter sp.]
MTTLDLTGRHQDSWHSFRSLPLWVQVWVGGILVPVNAVAFLFLDTPGGLWTAIAAVLVMVSNYPIMLACRGMSRLMSVPHLLIWGPLQVFLIYHLMVSDASARETMFILLVLIVNGISLMLDALDSWRWCRGEREVPGHG